MRKSRKKYPKEAGMYRTIYAEERVFKRFDTLARRTKQRKMDLWARAVTALERELKA